MMNNTNDQVTIENLRAAAAMDLASSCPSIRARGLGVLRMVEVLKVKMLARGESVTVVSSTGAKWGRK